MPRTIGAFVFPTIWQDWSLNEADRFLRSLRDFGVNTIATESETYRDDLIELAHRLGLRFVGGIACFSEHGRNNQPLHDQPELWPILETGERRPLMEWYIGVTPTIEVYREARLDEITRIVRDHDLDGLCLDFIRWPLHWELELRPGQPEPLQSSFDPYTIQHFLAFAGLELPADATTTPSQAAWILREHRAVWTDFKCRTITTFVSAARQRIQVVRGRDTELGVYLVPALDAQRAYLVGQRAADLAQVTDFLSPMVYHPVLHRTPAWIKETVDEMILLTPGKVLPVLQVDSAEGAVFNSDWGLPVPVDEWRAAACAAAQRQDTLGLVAFTGTALFADGRGEILLQCLSEH